MSPQFSFPYQGRVLVAGDDRFEIAYYARGYCKYKRTRELGVQTWEETVEVEIDQDHFMMIAACIERGRVTRRGMV